jgi:hypothetical protein
LQYFITHSRRFHFTHLVRRAMTSLRAGRPGVRFLERTWDLPLA